MAIPLLARRIGLDTLSKLEGAAGRRLLEARALIDNGQVLGAVYLLGYSVEARIGAAYFRLAGFRPNTEITDDIRRRVVKAAILDRIMSRQPHDVAGWAQLLVATRKQRAIGFRDDFKAELVRQARALYARWRPNLRYRTTVPTAGEVAVVVGAAEWFEEHYLELWR